MGVACQLAAAPSSGPVWPPLLLGPILAASLGAGRVSGQRMTDVIFGEDQRPSEEDVSRPGAVCGAMPRMARILRDQGLVHEWRVAQRKHPGIPGPLAEAGADHVDWHQIARLVQRGCSPRLALRIVR
jgi:hypothetical protein